MFEWVPIAVLSYLFMSVVDITTKIARTRYFRDSAATTSILLFGQALPVLLFPLVNWAADVPTALSALFLGALTAVPFWLYSESLRREEVSRVAALWQTIPLFVLILAFLFLGERLPQLFYLSFVFLLFGSLLVSAKGLKNLLKPDKTFWMMLLASFTWASQLVALKFLYTNEGFLEIFVLMCAGRLLAAFAFPLLLRSANDFSKELLAADKGLLALFFLANGAGVFLYHYAVSLGSVTIVEAISGFQAFFTLLFAVSMSWLAPSVIREKTGAGAVALKLFAITLMFIGLVLIYI